MTIHALKREAIYTFNGAGGKYSHHKYSDAYPLVPISTGLGKGETMLYRQEGHFVPYAELTVADREKMTAWGVANGFIEHKQVFYIVEVHDHGKQSSYQEVFFATEQEAKDYLEKNQLNDRILTAAAYVTTQGYCKKMGLRPLFSRKAEMSVHLHFLATQFANFSGVYFDVDEDIRTSSNIGTAFLFGYKTREWKAVPNLVACVVNDMQKQEQEVAKRDANFVKRVNALKSLKSNTRYGNTNYFVEKVAEDTHLIVGCSQFGICRGLNYTIYKYPNESFKSMLDMALTRKTKELHNAIKVQIQR